MDAVRSLRLLLFELEGNDTGFAYANYSILLIGGIIIFLFPLSEKLAKMSVAPSINLQDLLLLLQRMTALKPRWIRHLRRFIYR